MQSNRFFFIVSLNILFVHFAAMCNTDPYQHIPATVSLETSLCQQEKDFVNIRNQYVQTACTKLLDESLWCYEVPTIALCFSGGGYRAMVEAIGFLIGADAIGLLDATMYTSGLSGSTWALTPWVFSGMNIKDYKEQLKPKINYNFSSYIFNLSFDERQAIYDLQDGRYADSQQFGLVDLYGALLANTLLDELADNKQKVYLSDLAPRVADGSFPLPICTAVAGGVNNHHLWFEFTPFQTGSMQTGFIPTWGLGRNYENGESKEIEPGRYARQQSLGRCMGIWGSAFSVDGDRVHHELRDTLSYQSLQYLGYFLYALTSYLPDYGYVSSIWPDTNQNFAAATVGNFTHDMKHEGWLNWWHGKDKEIIPLTGNRELSLIDGAFDLVDGRGMNLGIVPLLRPERNVDVIIICDSSADLVGSPSLYAAEQRAKTMGLKFPKIDYAKTDQSIISVFEDEYDSSVPTVIYMPGIKNPKYGHFDPATAYYTSTTNFAYSPEQIDELSGLTEFAVLQNRDVIVNAIKRAVDKKRMPLLCC